MTREKIVAGRGGSMKYGNGIRYHKRETISQSRNWITIGALVLGLFFAGAMEAGAVSNYYTNTTSGQGFVGTYGSSPLASLTGNARCIICHPNYPSSTARNSFGSDFAGNGHLFNATLNNMDSDGDLFSNLTEINAGTYPGNAASFPAGTNTAPVAVNDSYSVAAGTTLTVNAATGVLANDTDAQSNPLTAALVAAPSSGTLNLSSNGSFTYVPTIASGSVTFTYRANDGSLDSATAATVTITVTAATAAGPLTVTPAGGLTSSGTAGGPFTPSSVSYTLTNSGGSPMNWTATKVASWVTLSSAGGALAAGAPVTVTVSIGTGANSLAVGSYTDNVTFTNTSNGTGNTTRPVSLTVNAVAAPTISTVSLPAGAVNTAYSQTLAATGGTTPYSWSVSSGTLPAGLSLSATGVLDGMPTAEGTSSFTVRVAGSDSASSTKDFSVTTNAAEPVPITLSSDSGGACSVAVRTGSGGSDIDGTLILAGLGLTVWGIRIRRRRG